MQFHYAGGLRAHRAWTNYAHRACTNYAPYIQIKWFMQFLLNNNNIKSINKSNLCIIIVY